MKLLLIAAVAFYFVVCQAEGARWNEPSSVQRGGRPSALLHKKKEQANQKKTSLRDEEKPYLGISVRTKIREFIEGIVSILLRIKENVEAFGWVSVSKLIKTFIKGFNEFLDDFGSGDRKRDKTFRGSLGLTTTRGY